MAVRTDSLRGIALVLAATIVCSGCARLRQSPYAYAPPYAPPVYPQPGAPQQVPCPPACDPCAGQAVTPVAYEGAVQTQPCPPGM